MHAPAASRSPSRSPSLGEILLLGSLTAFGAVTIDLYLPTLPAIARDYGTSDAAVQLTLSTFFVGMAVGQLFFGPLSDRIGRRPTILMGCGVYVLASIACALAPTIEALVAGRFFQALGCCAAMVTCRAIVRDRYDHRDSARIFSLLMLVLAIAPLLAPTVGGWIAAAAGWHAVFQVFIGVGLAIAAAVWWRLDESRSAATAATAASTSVLAGYAVLLRHRRLIGYLLVGAANGATLFSYIAGSPDLVINIWGYSESQFGLIFAIFAVGVVGASQINRLLLRKATPDQVLGAASIGAAVAGAMLLACAVLGAPLFVLFPALFIALSSNGLIAANASAGALNVDPLRAGAISGLMGGVNFAVGALASALAAALHDGTAVPMAANICVALLIAAVAYHGLAKAR
ncbi:multidrug effflux MFS transporter [Sandarakinorhabdus cyanobacteriorum]|uniref:multidrug effflux MFS transporter n=1 Tax=Sandarakinorhabdus cyanobacteriorum TaxID=1981098 RepID=UPI001056A393|nr:multidrug effflux MFS transporter [Sandarakinorhabdus cyanobacteriorum]